MCDRSADKEKRRRLATYSIEDDWTDWTDWTDWIGSSPAGVRVESVGAGSEKRFIGRAAKEIPSAAFMSIHPIYQYGRRHPSFFFRPSFFARRPSLRVKGSIDTFSLDIFALSLSLHSFLFSFSYLFWFLFILLLFFCSSFLLFLFSYKTILLYSLLVSSAR